MSLTTEQVEAIANLARLELSAEEKELMSRQLSDILDYVNRLQALDTGGIQPTFTPFRGFGVLPPRSVLRPDEARPGLERETLLRNASEIEAGQFRVPAVLE